MKGAWDEWKPRQEDWKLLENHSGNRSIRRTFRTSLMCGLQSNEKWAGVQVLSFTKESYISRTQ